MKPSKKRFLRWILCPLILSLLLQTGCVSAVLRYIADNARSESSSYTESSESSWWSESSSESSVWWSESSSESSEWFESSSESSEWSESSAWAESSESSEYSESSEWSESSNWTESSESSSWTESSTTTQTYHPNLGTAGEIEGRTILVSIFVNNTRYSWNFDDDADFQTYSELYYHLKTAAEWIESTCASWGTQTEIVWDWYNNKDLYYVANFDIPMNGATSTRYGEIYDWLVTNIPTETLLETYDADNIIYMWYVDTTLDEEENSFAFQFDYSGLTEGQVGYEGVWFNVRHDGFSMGAPTLAHELLHLFGARDLYYTDNYITQEYMDYLVSIGSEDIMYMVYDDPDNIIETFSELDAYYVGLTNYSYDQQRFGLGVSPHIW